MDGTNEGQLSVKERLIAAGIHELNTYGLPGFSVRRVAEECGVSCAAPYKHFKDRKEFLTAIVENSKRLWVAQLLEIAGQYPGQYRKQLLEISLAYIRFLVENPYARSIIMYSQDQFDSWNPSLQDQINEAIHSIVEKYCMGSPLPGPAHKRKGYVIRSLIYGAVLMFDNGEEEYNEENMGIIAHAIDREFDLD